jgi:hypothetical protein
MDSPSNMEQLPSIHVVPPATNIPLWSHKHHHLVVLFTSLWNLASMLHFFQANKGFCHPLCCCWLLSNCHVVHMLNLLNIKSFFP